MRYRSRCLSAIAPCACALVLATGCRIASEPAPTPPQSAVAPAARPTVSRLPPACSDATGDESSSHPDVRLAPCADAAAGDVSRGDSGAIRLVQGQESRRDEPLPSLEPPPPSIGLKLPKNLPGADAPPIVMPPDASPQERFRIIDLLFPNLPGLKPIERFEPLPDGRALRLDDLQAIATDNSPLLRQARGDVLAARGKAIDAGAYPNPQLGYEMDTVGTFGTAGYQGGMWNQTIKTAGKLGLARSAAMMDVRNAELALRKARIDLATKVQAGYFAVLVAQQRVDVSRALVQFTDEVYRVQVDRLRVGDAAAYEPAQSRVLAVQARAAAWQARNRHIAAWAQLTATLGVPEMPPTALSGSADLTVPEVPYDAALARVLATHTDLLAAQNGIAKARYKLRLQEVLPVPDLNTYVAVQKDYTGPPFATTVNLQAFVPVPILYRNQGGIIDAQGQLVRATHDVARVRNDLVARLADAFERYENARTVVVYYRERILPDQARAYRGVYERYQQADVGVNYNDIITTQQTLAASILQYINVLGDQWAAVTDLANIMQVESLAELDEHVPPPQSEPSQKPAAPARDE